jgi:hypothetical protein
VALPAAHEETESSFAHYEETDLPVLEAEFGLDQTPRLFLNPSHQDLSLGSTISYRKAVQSSSGEKRTATDAPVPER